MAERDAVAEYRRIRRLQLLLIFAMAVVWALFAVYLAWKPAWVDVEPYTVFLATAVATAALMLAQLVLLRCPACRRYIGTRFAIDQCPGCNARFR